MPYHIFAMNVNIGGQTKSNRNKETRYLTEDQAKCMYKKVESGNMININTIKQEIDQERKLNRLDDTSGDINPYSKLIVNNAERVDMILSQMEQWLKLSIAVNYIKYDRQMLRVRFWRNAREIKERIFRHIWGNSVRNNECY